MDEAGDECVGRTYFEEALSMSCCMYFCGFPTLAAWCPCCEQLREYRNVGSFNEHTHTHKNPHPFHQFRTSVNSFVLCPFRSARAMTKMMRTMTWRSLRSTYRRRRSRCRSRCRIWQGDVWCHRIWHNWCRLQGKAGVLSFSKSCTYMHIL